MRQPQFISSSPSSHNAFGQAHQSPLAYETIVLGRGIGHRGCSAEDAPHLSPITPAIAFLPSPRASSSLPNLICSGLADTILWQLQVSIYHEQRDPTWCCPDLQTATLCRCWNLQIQKQTGTYWQTELSALTSKTFMKSSSPWFSIKCRHVVGDSSVRFQSALSVNLRVVSTTFWLVFCFTIWSSC